MSPLRAAPITAECLVICVALFVVCQIRTLDGVRFGDAQREWGAVTNLQVYAIRADRREVADPDWHGPFDLWDGEWWRVPVNAFHHADVLHLLMNCVAAWGLGSRLERRWGSLRFAVFLLPSIYIPMLAEMVNGHVAVGFSGAICSMLGALIALKQFDDDDILPDQVVQFGVAFLVLGLWASKLEVMRVANVAHFVGLAYGWFSTWAMCGPFEMKRSIRGLFLFSHIGLYSLTWYVVQPIGNGRYHWYIADRLSDPRQKTSMLKFAVQCDPSLTGVWMRLAEGKLIEGEVLDAWSTLAKGLSFNPTRRELLDALRRVWRRIPPGIDRMEAEHALKQIFGERAGDWLTQIKQTTVVSAEPRAEESDELPDAAINTEHFPLDQKIDLDWQPRQNQPPGPQPLDPKAPDSAAEGQVL